MPQKFDTRGLSQTGKKCAFYSEVYFGRIPAGAPSQQIALTRGLFRV
ncbi:MAG: hypothetical protein ACI8Z1_002748 [Candidatus Azotimanducaceae bacterium]|jgi:hypothetical protein